ncbi:MAG TPA: hypothetical protein VL651_03925 [Bacteroidia bacterium]|jgi:hypothetical protein|nr:hypothetical protein [Bacteroidia bacterium]
MRILYLFFLQLLFLNPRTGFSQSVSDSGLVIRYLSTCTFDDTGFSSPHRHIEIISSAYSSDSACRIITFSLSNADETSGITLESHFFHDHPVNINYYDFNKFGNILCFQKLNDGSYLLISESHEVYYNYGLFHLTFNDSSINIVPSLQLFENGSHDTLPWLGTQSAMNCKPPDAEDSIYYFMRYDRAGQKVNYRYTKHQDGDDSGPCVTMNGVITIENGVFRQLPEKKKKH